MKMELREMGCEDRGGWNWFRIMFLKQAVLNYQVLVDSKRF
jgi:hypothetical protein